jgi:1-acyl-sn-glycerol-3-phosphate acyltransferase
MHESYQGGGKLETDLIVEGNLSKRYVIWPLVQLCRLVVHSDTHFEEGAIEELHNHRDSGGALLIAMTHFRHMEPIVMAQLAGTHEPLRHIWYTTGITGKESLLKKPFGIGWIMRRTGIVPVVRSIDHPNETPTERAERIEKNQRAQAIGGRFLARGHNWLIYPEGGTKRVIKENGKIVRQKREDLHTLLPIQRGVGYILDSMTTKEQRRVRLLGISVYYGKHVNLFPTVYISRPAAPNGETIDDYRLQVEDLLQHGLSEAIRLRHQRRFMRNASS